MTDSIKDLLAQKDFKEPDEIEEIKRFIKDSFNSESKVKISDNAISITVDNSALAGALRPELHKLQKRLKTDKKILLFIR